MTDMSSPGGRGVVVALSGGLDSAVLLARYAARGDRLTTVSVDYGQRHRRELTAARRLAAHYDAEHVRIDVPSFGAAVRSALTDSTAALPCTADPADPAQRATVVPGRNAVIATLAVSIAVARGAEIVALGIHGGDGAVYPDCRAEFLAALAALTDVGNAGFSPPRIQAPFLTVPKAEVVAVGSMLGAPLALTYSCYAGQERHCRTCGACRARADAFGRAGLPDPTRYAEPVGTA